MVSAPKTSKNAFSRSDESTLQSSSVTDHAHCPDRNRTPALGRDEKPVAVGCDPINFHNYLSVIDRACEGRRTSQHRVLEKRGNRRDRTNRPDTGRQTMIPLFLS